MNDGKSDASTSTDDVKDRPLCLFYFTHPFGVLSPEPPTISAAPPSVTRAFLNMEPISPFYWPSSGGTQETPDEAYRSSTPSSVAYELGAATVHHQPVSVLSVARARRCAVQLPRRDSSTLSSSLFASDVWFPSSGSDRVAPVPRRPPYTRILPPLRLPSPRDLTDYASDDIWPRKCLNRFSLPPLNMPAAAAASQPVVVTLVRSKRREEPTSVESVASAREVKCKRKLGVNKARRRRRVGHVRKMVTCLMRRATKGGGSSLQECSPSPALQHVLSTIREAWTEPTSLKDRCRVLSRMNTRSCALERVHALEGDSERESDASAMLTRTQLTELPPRADASPGLLCRRYSVPETIMRKYRLAQLNSDSEESGVPEGGGAAACGACLSPPRDSPRSAGESPRHLRRDRELMRKSALLRRMWARPTAPVPVVDRTPAPAPALAACCCETRSLDGSRTELRAERESEASRLRWPDHKRPRRDSRAPPSTADLSDSTRGPDLSSYVETDGLSDGTVSPPRGSLQPRSCPQSGDTDSAPASLDTDAELPRAMHLRDRLYSDSDAFSASVPAAKDTPGTGEPARSDYISSNEQHFEGRVSAREPSVENDEHNALSSERLVCDAPAPYEVLEIVVSESASSSPPDATAVPRAPPRPHRAARDLDIDEYVSRVLVESLNTLSDRLEGMNASMGTDRKMSVVEKEIKVRLQNAAVNTIVHLSPTSNNQIIFGNEELCDEEALADADVCNERHRGEAARDECNNPCALESLDALERHNNNASPSASPTPRSDSFDAILQHDNVNRAVLQQIQKLFRDDLRHDDRETSFRDDMGGVSHIEISNVDAYLSGGIGADTISVSTRDVGAPLAGVGAGNYFRDAQHVALVPRHSALPHSASMEVNTSSSEDADADALGSDVASLVDSLDDPSSPRAAVLRRPNLARSGVDVLDLLPGGTPRDGSGGEAFFVRMREDAAPESARVAECMPERIRQKLHRRHRKRELRMECARRGKVRQLREELERRRRDELARECGAMVDSLLDDVIAKIAQDEYRCMRIERRNEAGANASRSQENLNRKTGRRDPPIHRDRETQRSGKHDARRRRSDDGDERSRRSERHQIRGKLLARPSIASAERGPHRIYQKSEIREGDKCIEILEILEYSHASRSSPDSTPTDESGERGRGRRSRIPVPVQEHMRLTGGDARAAPPFADLLLRALAPSQRLPPPPPPQAPSEPRERSNSLRFKRVFDMIPEERGSLSFDSSADAEAEDADCGRRASAPDLIEAATPAPSAPVLARAPVDAPAPVLITAPAPVPLQSPRRVPTRSAATSPPAEARRLRSQMTMTSPSSKSAATSPWRAPPASPTRPPPRPPPPREGSREPESCVPMRAERRSVPTQCDREKRDAESEYEEDFLRAFAESSAFQRTRQADAQSGGGGAGSGGAASAGSSSGSSGDSGGSLLCSLAPRWLSAHARQRRRTRRDPPPDPPPPPPPDQNATGGWSVTVAGTCRAALPADVEMRLRFPHERRPPRPHPAPASASASASASATRGARHQECMCAMCAGCPPPPAAPALPPARPPSRHERCGLTLTMKKEAQDSSIVASKSTRKSSDPLPDLETYRASRTKLKSSMKTRRGYSLHCWLPDDEPAPIRANNGLSVLGCAIIPELKPRVPTMSERDLTRVYTPRHYLRS